MLYTTRPLERIYCDMNKEPEETPVELTEFPTEYGVVYAENIEGEYYIRNFKSSYMPDYLDDRYQIGSVYHMD